jgi:hypothetical protein
VGEAVVEALEDESTKGAVGTKQIEALATKAWRKICSDCTLGGLILQCLDNRFAHNIGFEGLFGHSSEVAKDDALGLLADQVTCMFVKQIFLGRGESAWNLCWLIHRNSGQLRTWHHDLS